MGKQLHNRVNKENREFLKIFLANNGHLKRDSLVLYERGVTNFLLWCYQFRDNKSLTEIVTEDIILYQAYLINDKKFKANYVLSQRAYISVFMNFLYKHFPEQFSERGVIFKDTPIPSDKKYEDNEPLSNAEYRSLCVFLKNREQYLPLLYLQLCHQYGFTLLEVQNMKRSAGDAKRVHLNLYEVFIDGRKDPVHITTNIMKTLWKAIENREDDNEYIFVSNNMGVYSQMHYTTFYYWSKKFI